jgi:hypothetical protein
MFRSARLFSLTNHKTGAQEWFFSSREGDIGPFYCEDKAEYALREFVNFNIEMNNYGGRPANIPNISKKTLNERINCLMADQNTLFTQSQFGLLPDTKYNEIRKAK